SCATNLLPENSVLLSSRAPIGHIAINTVPMATNQGFKSLIPGDQILPKFLYYWLMDHKEYLQSLGVGATFKELSKKTVENIKLDLPPLEEQVKQVEIRDLQSMIAQKRERQQELFDEFQVALFHEMFTGKDWPTKLLGEVATVVSGATPKTSNEGFWGGKVNWVTPAELSKLDGIYIGKTERTLTEAGLASCSAQILPAGSVLLSSRAPIGLVAINTVPMATNQGFKSLIPSPEIEPLYLYFWLKLNTKILHNLGVGATFKELSQKTLNNLKIPVPTIISQQNFTKIILGVSK
ncbi:restriction endonuclease subunit S, partial [Rothia nasimurium]|uniref:restriction endonuclease subunit S n=1 Tax=Rothia nasimurium TaxID=85336 RepID=UPI003B9EDDE8